MASILNVDQINNAAGTSAVTIDASTGKPSFPNGATLPAGSVVNVTRVQDTGINTTISSNTLTNIITFSVTATAGNLMHLSTVIGTRGDASSSWNLTNLRILAGGVSVYGSGYNGINGTQEIITDIPVDVTWVWGGTGLNAQTIEIQARSYDGYTRHIGTSSQVTETTTPVFTLMEIAQ
jgi:hypothetical protein